MTSKFNFRNLAAKNLISLGLNLIQLLAAVIVIIISGIQYRFNHGGFLYAIIVALISILTVLLFTYLSFKPPTHKIGIIALLVWQFILAVLWGAAAGVLADDSWAAAAFAIIAMLCWLLGVVMGGIGLCCAGRRGGEGKVRTVDWAT